MARRKLQFTEGEYYHIYNRGAARRSIFVDDTDYLTVLWAMRKYITSLRITVIAYCLMPNHYHWLVRQDDVILARLFPQRVFNGYVKTFNHRHQRSGTLFEGPFEAKPVADDFYLHQLCRYIHANPVKDGFATAPELWPYSNYQEWMGLRNGKLVDRDFISTHFPDVSVYQRFVHDYLTGRDQLPPALSTYLQNL